MKLLQATGPFIAGYNINFSYPEGRQYKYVHVGVQAPHVPPITETRYDNADNQINGMFAVTIGENNNNNPQFYINANDIIEFDDLYRSNSIKIMPLQNMDAYTIIEIMFLDEDETS